MVAGPGWVAGRVSQEEFLKSNFLKLMCKEKDEARMREWQKERYVV